MPIVVSDRGVRIQNFWVEKHGVRVSLKHNGQTPQE